MNKKMILAACVVACITTGCERENNNSSVVGGNGTILIETTVKNPDGMSGSSYIQLVPSLSGSIDNSNAIQLNFGDPISIIGNDVFTFPSFGREGSQQLRKYSYDVSSKSLQTPQTMDVTPGAGAYNLTSVTDEKAYMPLYNLGTVWIINPKTMQKTGEIDLKPYAHVDASAEPAIGRIYNGKYYLPLDQISGDYQPYNDYQQTDVAIIDINTDKVLKMVSEKTTGLTFPTRPFLKDMIFIDEQNDLYIACTGYFGFSPNNRKNGFVCISTTNDEFDTSKSWDISETIIEGSSEKYKPSSVLNCKYLGGGKVAAYVCIQELNTANPYTARNAMAVIIDLKAKTIKKVEGIPYTDGHSIFIDTYKNQVVWSSYGENQVGFFTTDFNGGNVALALVTSGGPTFMHSFE